MRDNNLKLFLYENDDLKNLHDVKNPDDVKILYGISDTFTDYKIGDIYHNPINNDLLVVSSISFYQKDGDSVGLIGFGFVVLSSVESIINFFKENFRSLNRNLLETITGQSKFYQFKPIPEYIKTNKEIIYKGNMFLDDNRVISYLNFNYPVIKPVEFFASVFQSYQKQFEVEVVDITCKWTDGPLAELGIDFILNRNIEIIYPLLDLAVPLENEIKIINLGTQKLIRGKMFNRINPDSHVIMYDLDENYYASIYFDDKKCVNVQSFKGKVKEKQLEELKKLSFIDIYYPFFYPTTTEYDDYLIKFI